MTDKDFFATVNPFVLSIVPGVFEVAAGSNV